MPCYQKPVYFALFAIYTKTQLLYLGDFGSSHFDLFCGRVMPCPAGAEGADLDAHAQREEERLGMHGRVQQHDEHRHGGVAYSTAWTRVQHHAQDPRILHHAQDMLFGNKHPSTFCI